VRGLEREYAGRIEFIFINILLPESVEYIETLGFGATPELYLVDSNGQITAFWDEIVSADDLRPVFDEVLGR
jgi:hypothetical protein